MTDVDKTFDEKEQERAERQQTLERDFETWLAGRSLGFNVNEGWHFILPNTTQPVKMDYADFETFVGFLDGVDW